MRCHWVIHLTRVIALWKLLTRLIPFVGVIIWIIVFAFVSRVRIGVNHDDTGVELDYRRQDNDIQNFVMGNPVQQKIKGSNCKGTEITPNARSRRVDRLYGSWLFGKLSHCLDFL